MNNIIMFFKQAVLIIIILFAGAEIAIKYTFDESYAEVTNEIKLLTYKANFDKQIRAKSDSLESRVFKVERIVSN